MIDILERVRALVAQGNVLVSAHGYDELAQDGISVADVVAGVAAALPVETYPDYHKGPSVLVLQYDSAGHPIHVLWGIPRDSQEPAVVVTAYRPDPGRWSDGFTRRVT